MIRLGVALGLVAAAIVLLVRPADLRLRDDAVAPQADEVVERVQPLVGMLLEKPRQPLRSAP